MTIPYSKLSRSWRNVRPLGEEQDEAHNESDELEDGTDEGASGSGDHHVKIGIVDLGGGGSTDCPIGIEDTVDAAGSGECHTSGTTGPEDIADDASDHGDAIDYNLDRADPGSDGGCEPQYDDRASYGEDGPSEWEDSGCDDGDY